MNKINVRIGVTGRGGAIVYLSHSTSTGYTGLMTWGPPQEGPLAVLQIKPREETTGPRKEFRVFSGLSPEIRFKVWNYARPFVPRVIKCECKFDESTLSYVNLFSRAQANFDMLCHDSKNVHSGIFDRLSQSYWISKVMAASEDGDIIHFGPDYDISNLKSFVDEVGEEEAKMVKQVILEYQIENIDSERRRNNGVFFIPKFFEICQLLPNLRGIILVSHDLNRGSNQLRGDLIFTTRDSTKHQSDGMTFKDKSEKDYAFFLLRQLEGRRMRNIPIIRFMEPFETSTRDN